MGGERGSGGLTKNAGEEATAKFFLLLQETKGR